MNKKLINEISQVKSLMGLSIHNHVDKDFFLTESNSKVLKNFNGDIQNGPLNHGKRALGNWQSDNAWDLFAPVGTKWYSITKGKVSKVRDTGKTTGKIYGTQVTVKGEDGYPDIFYTHLKNVVVSVGNEINVGDLIGEISEWGTSKSTHVHVGLPYGEHIDDLLTSDYSQPKNFEDSQDVNSQKEIGFIDKLLDKFGIKKISNVNSKQDVEKFADDVKKEFGDDKVEKKDDDFEIFGYSLTDVVDKAKKLFENRLNEDIKKMKKPLK